MYVLCYTIPWMFVLLLTKSWRHDHGTHLLLWRMCQKKHLKLQKLWISMILLCIWWQWMGIAYCWQFCNRWCTHCVPACAIRFTLFHRHACLCPGTHVQNCAGMAVKVWCAQQCTMKSEARRGVHNYTIIQQFVTRSLSCILLNYMLKIHITVT